MATQAAKPDLDQQIFAEQIAMVHGLTQLALLIPLSLREHVLLVEYPVVNQTITRIMLESFGLRVSTAEDGVQALASIETQTIDIVLMDCQMPVLNGFQATRRLREKDKHVCARRHIPVAAVTANAIDGDHDLCLSAGMDDYLSKPFRRAELHAKLVRWLPGVESQASL